MLRKQWIRQAEANGWRLVGQNPGVTRLVCSKFGCLGEIEVSTAHSGPAPDPCDLPHLKQYGGAAAGGYTAMVQELTRRRRALGLSQEDVCAASGLADGHINKLEAFKRIAQPPTLQLWANTLGASLVLANDTMPARTIEVMQARSSDPYHANQARNLHTPDQRRLICGE